MKKAVDLKKGARLRKLRLKAGLSQSELARRTGTWPTNIIAIETGTSPLGYRRAERFAAVLGVSVELLTGLSSGEIQALRDGAAARLAARDAVKS